MNRKGKRLYYIALVAFCLSSVIPLLIFVYVLVERGILDYPLAALCLVMGLALAVLGYLFLRSGFQVLHRVAESLIRSTEEPGAEIEAAPGLAGRVLEADEILGAFERTTDRLKESVDRIDTLNDRFAFLGELVHVASCAIEPKEMATLFLKGIMESVPSKYGVVTYIEEKDAMGVMAALPEEDLPGGLLSRLYLNTQRVLRTKNPYLGCNLSPEKIHGAGEEEGPVVSWPVSHRGEVLAVLHLGREWEASEYTHDDFKVIRLAADLLGLALENIRWLSEDSLFTDDEPGGEPVPRDGEDEDEFFGARVLVVDDEPLLRKALGNFLASRGYRVQYASSGEEAMSILAESHPVVILLGLKLRDMDGIEILRKVQKDMPGTGVVIVAGQIDTDVFSEARELGALDCLVRPIDFNYLENLLLIQ